MRKKLSAGAIAGMLLVAMEAIAANTADELWIAAVGRGPGAAGSSWITDLYVTNSGEDAVEVQIAFAGTPPGGDPISATVEPGATRVFADLLGTSFGVESGFGALHIEAVTDEDEEDFGAGEAELGAYARIYHTGAEGTFGQSVQALSDEAAISAGSEVPAALIGGVTNSGSFRTNWFAFNLTADEEDEPGPAEMLVEVLGANGVVVAAKEYAIAPASSLFVPASDLAASIENGTLRVTMIEGSAIVGASLIDSRTNDPTTLEATHRPARDAEFTDEFPSSEGCSFISRGDNPFFRLEPGLTIVMEGEEDGQTIEQTIEVLDETEMVNGVRTRVVVETESVDGEIVEISRNFFAECSATQSVFYFGEEVDIYEDGEIVSHEGAWRAGQNGARPGIIMPGEVLVGSRYYQEVAPGVALDRAEHVATGVTVETEIGELEDCLVVRDSTALDPSAGGDVKIYCPGVGLVRDGVLEIVEVEEEATVAKAAR